MAVQALDAHLHHRLVIKRKRLRWGSLCLSYEEEDGGGGHTQDNDECDDDAPPGEPGNRRSGLQSHRHLSLYLASSSQWVDYFKSIPIETNRNYYNKLS